MKFSTINGKTQLTLDFGQKEFGSTRCKDCGMVYTIGDADDLKTHKTYHRAQLFPSFRLPRGQHQRIIEERFDGSHIIELLIGTPTGMNCFSSVANLMNQDLGTDKPLYTSRVNNNTNSHLANGISDNWRVFLHVIDKSRLVVGCCVVEELTTERICVNNYKFRRLKGGRQSLLSWRVANIDPTQCSVNKCSGYGEEVEINEPLCGIRRLWVSKEYRRCGNATALIDAIIKSLFYGLILNRSQIAFTEPTSNGADFAASYVGREDFLIY